MAEKNLKRNYEQIIDTFTKTQKRKLEYALDNVLPEHKASYKKALKDRGLEDFPLSDIPVNDRVSISEFCRVWGSKGDSQARYHLRMHTGLIKVIGLDPRPPHNIILSRTEALQIKEMQERVDAGGQHPFLRRSHHALPEVPQARQYYRTSFSADEIRIAKNQLVTEGTSLDILINEIIGKALERSGTAKKKNFKKAA